MHQNWLFSHTIRLRYYIVFNNGITSSLSVSYLKQTPTGSCSRGTITRQGTSWHQLAKSTCSYLHPAHNEESAHRPVSGHVTGYVTAISTILPMVCEARSPDYKSRCSGADLWLLRSPLLFENRVDFVSFRRSRFADGKCGRRGKQSANLRRPG